MGKGFEKEVHFDKPDNLAQLLQHSGTRRQVLKLGAAGMAAALPLGPLMGCAAISSKPEALLGFKSVSSGSADQLIVPEGYTTQVLYAWGDATGIQGRPEAAFRWDAGNSAAEQALQSGMHHDAIEYFALPRESRDASRALLAINHEYTDDGMLHGDGMKTWSAEKVRKAQAASGVSVIEVERQGTKWQVVGPSRYARRITSYTEMSVSGPAAGSALLRTASDPSGTKVLGTINNCAGGMTPWGTYLTCEENFNGYFANGGAISTDQRRYGMSANGAGYRWHEFDARFDARAHPNEFNRFGWVVEIDPYDPLSVPVKRTALGRIKHEGAMFTRAADGRAVIYMGDDERFEYIYKFVSATPVDLKSRAANRNLLDSGTLYVGKFAANGEGTWIELVHGKNGLDASKGFTSQADVLIKTRQAADAVGATRMDRPEWAAVHPVSGDVYVTLTNNDRRGGKDQPATDSANPRAENVFGHIVRWRESGGDAAATSFRWEHFVLAGDPANADPGKRGNVKGDVFGSPDGLYFDPRGVLWIQTDVSTAAMHRGDYAKLGNNQMLAADVNSGEIRRFLVGPSGCEITGCVMAPDGRSLFINIQHPGETASERTDPASPRAVSNWPDFRPDGRPRSATVVIRKSDGGLIGT